MPLRSLRPCGHSGCRELTRAPYCTAHQADAYRYDRHRGTSAQRGYGSKWAAYSRRYRRERPICAQCPNLAKLVDHIIPVTGPGDPNFWTSRNHQGLCQDCHNRKIASEGLRNTEYGGPRKRMIALPKAGGVDRPIAHGNGLGNQPPTSTYHVDKTRKWVV